ncbi:hypothetical protein HK102_000193 [Quaeritorhiza haematococci]|nr:hypothetical protein HK102_000193 [Quaeritorhiza haematococci]
MKLAALMRHGPGACECSTLNYHQLYGIAPADANAPSRHHDSIARTLVAHNSFLVFFDKSRDPQDYRNYLTTNKHTTDRDPPSHPRTPSLLRSFDSMKRQREDDSDGEEERGERKIRPIASSKRLRLDGLTVPSSPGAPASPRPPIAKPRRKPFFHARDPAISAQAVGAITSANLFSSLGPQQQVETQQTSLPVEHVAPTAVSAISMTSDNSHVQQRLLSVEQVAPTAVSATPVNIGSAQVQHQGFPVERSATTAVSAIPMSFIAVPMQNQPLQGERRVTTAVSANPTIIYDGHRENQLPTAERVASVTASEEKVQLRRPPLPPQEAPSTTSSEVKEPQAKESVPHGDRIAPTPTERTETQRPPFPTGSVVASASAALPKPPQFTDPRGPALSVQDSTYARLFKAFGADAETQSFSMMFSEAGRLAEAVQAAKFRSHVPSITLFLAKILVALKDAVQSGTLAPNQMVKPEVGSKMAITLTLIVKKLLENARMTKRGPQAGPQPQLGDSIMQFLSECRSFLGTIPIPAPLMQGNTPSAHDILRYVDHLLGKYRNAQTIFRTLADVFKILFQEGKSNDEQHYADGLKEWVWMFFLFSKDVLWQDHTVQNEYDGILALYCILFVASQAPPGLRRPMSAVFGEIMGIVSQERRTQVEACIARVGPLQGDYLAHFMIIKELLCLVYAFPLELYAQNETDSLHKIVEALSKQQKIFANCARRPAVTGWPVYSPCFLAECHGGFFQANYMALKKHTDYQLYSRNLDVDFRCYLPQVNVNEMSARRVFRTPGVTVRESTLRNLNRSDFKHLAKYSDKMSATPLTAQSLWRMTDEQQKNQEIDLPKLRKILYETLMKNVSPDPLSWLKNPRVEEFLMKMIESFVAQFRAKANNTIHENFAPECAKLSCSFLRTFVGRIYREIPQPSLEMILLDPQFFGSVLALAFELMRFAHQITLVSLDDVSRMLQLKQFELFLMTEIIISFKIIADTLHEHFRRVQERLLVSTIWKDHRFYDTLAGKSTPTDKIIAYIYLDCRKNQNAGVGTDVQFGGMNGGNVGMIAGDVGPSSGVGGMCGERGGDGGVDPTNLPQFKILRAMLRQLCVTKVRNICRRVDNPGQLEGKVWQVMDQLIHREISLQLFRCRSFDTVMLSVLFVVVRLTEGRSSPGSPESVRTPFQDIQGAYNGLSNRLSEALTGIYLAPGHSGDIKLYYSKIFLPVTKKMLLAMKIGWEGAVGDHYVERTPIQINKLLDINSPQQSKTTAGPASGYSASTKRLGLHPLTTVSISPGAAAAARRMTLNK